MSNHTWYNILLLGCVDVGKSAIIRRLDEGKFIHGLGTNSLGKEFIDRRISTPSGMVTCRVWDTADMERYSISLPSNLYRSKQGFVFVFSLTSKSSFRNLKVWIDNAKSYYPAGLPPSIILANKADDYLHSENNLTDVCEIYGEFKCFETSALDNSGVNEAFSYLATEILKSGDDEDGPDPVPSYPPYPSYPQFNFMKIIKTCSLL